MKRIRFLSLLLFLLFWTAVASAAAFFPSVDQNIQYFGRWLEDTDVMFCRQGTVYLRTNFTGTSLKVQFGNAPRFPIRWLCILDGKELPYMHQPTNGIRTLAENLEDREHSLTMIRVTEALSGESCFIGFLLDDGASLLPPPPAKKHHIEFIGDSITAGALNEIPEGWNPPLFGADYVEAGNGACSYAPLLAKLLDAEYTVVAKSGIGISHNYGEPPPYREVHAGDLYPWTLYSSQKKGEHPLWDFASHPVDAIVINLGTNDIVREDCLPEKEYFIASYQKFLALVRKKNPKTPIICIEPLPTIIPDHLRKWVEEAVTAYQKQHVEDAVYFIPLNANKPLLSRSDYAPDCGHPNKEGARKIADFLKPKMQEILHWE